MFNLLISFFISFFLLMTSCTSKKQPDITEKKQVVKSEDGKLYTATGIKYSFEEGNETSETVAKIGEEDITIAKLFPHIHSGFQDLQQHEYEEYVRNVYYQLKRKADKDKKVLKGEITFYMNPLKRSFNEILGFDKKQKAIKIKYNTDDSNSLIAKYEDTEISLSDIEANSLRYWSIKNRQYDLVWSRLLSIYINRSLLKLAKEKNLKIEDYLKQFVFNNIDENFKVTDKEFNEFLIKKKISEDDLTEEIKEKLVNIVREDIKRGLIEKHISKSDKIDDLVIYFKQPEAKIALIKDWLLISGPDNASNIVYLFSNFTSISSRKTEKNLIEIENSNPNLIKKVRIPFFAKTDRLSLQQSEASACLFKQDQKLYTAFANKMFEGQYALSDSQIIDFVKDSGSDEQQFKKCYLGRELKLVGEYYQSYNEMLGVVSQPTLVVNGKILTGSLTKEELLKALNLKEDINRNVSQASLEHTTTTKASFFERVLNYIKNIFN